MGFNAKCLTSWEKVCIPKKFPCSWDFWGKFLSQILETIWKTFSSSSPYKNFSLKACTFDTEFLFWKDVALQTTFFSQNESHFALNYYTQMSFLLNTQWRQLKHMPIPHLPHNWEIPQSQSHYLVTHHCTSQAFTLDIFTICFDKM